MPEWMYIYCTKTDEKNDRNMMSGKVVGRKKVIKILEGTLNYIWKTTKEKSGITRAFFYEYFNKKSKAFAYELGELELFEPIKLEDFGIIFSL